MSANCFSLWRTSSPQTPYRVSPLDPIERLLSPDPLGYSPHMNIPGPATTAILYQPHMYCFAQVKNQLPTAEIIEWTLKVTSVIGTVRRITYNFPVVSNTYIITTCVSFVVSVPHFAYESNNTVVNSFMKRILQKITQR